MFGIGFSEMLLIGVIILIAVGPKRLPELMKTVGKGVREIRRASNELRRSVGFDEMMRDADVRQLVREPAAPVVIRPRPLTDSERSAELPPEGLDFAEAEHRAQLGESLAAAAPRSPASVGAEPLPDSSGEDA